jgi:hypothetical protein
MHIRRIYIIAAGILFARLLIVVAANFSREQIGFGYYLIGHDEWIWQDNSIFYFENGFGLAAISDALGLASSFLNLGWPYLLGMVHSAVGLSYFNVLWVKYFFLFWAIVSLHDIVRFKTNCSDQAIISSVFLGIYYPLAAFDLAYIRDDFLVYSLLILLKLTMIPPTLRLDSLLKYSLVLFLSYIVLFTRPFALLVFFVISIFYLRTLRLTYVLFALVVLIPVVENIVSFSVITYAVNFLLKEISLGLYDIIFGSLKFYFGPIPLNMLYHESEYSPYWHSFTFILVSMSLLLRQVYSQALSEWKSMLGLFLVAVFPYIIHHQFVDGIGPRQFAMIGPILFVLLYSRIVKDLLSSCSLVKKIKW